MKENFGETIKTLPAAEAANQEKGEVKEIATITQERLAKMQTLEVEVNADFSKALEELRSETGTDLQPRPDGYHLTIISPTESKILNTFNSETLADLQQINEQIQKGEGVVIKGIGFIDGASGQYQMREVDRVKKTAFVAFDIPALQDFRAKVGLPPKDFHITIGLEGGDIHMQVIRQEPIKPGSSKMKDVTAPVPKQADPRFNAVVLPEIKYGGLDGQMKERK